MDVVRRKLAYKDETKVSKENLAFAKLLLSSLDNADFHFLWKLYPNVAKVGGLQSQGDKGAAIVDLLQALGNAGSYVLRLSRRGKKMA